MWAVLKVDKNYISLLKKDFSKKIGNDIKFYTPKLKINKFYKKKCLKEEVMLLGDYLLCFHKDFTKKSIINNLRYCRGLKYFLTGFLNSQIEIENFISECKKNEDNEGYIKPSFFDLKKNGKYQFISGPFTSLVFRILDVNKLSIKTLIGNFKVTVPKEQCSFRPV